MRDTCKCLPNSVKKLASRSTRRKYTIFSSINNEKTLYSWNSVNNVRCASHERFFITRRENEGRHRGGSSSSLLFSDGPHIGFFKSFPLSLANLLSTHCFCDHSPP